jgi:predicted nucleotidyltransferase
MDLDNIPQKYQKDIEMATNLLKREGCQSVYLFGSLVTGKNHDESDIDIGVKGLPHKKFFSVAASLDKETSNKIDLVDFDLSRDFYLLLDSLGEVFKLG